MKTGGVCEREKKGNWTTGLEIQVEELVRGGERQRRTAQRSMMSEVGGVSAQESQMRDSTSRLVSQA